MPGISNSNLFEVLAVKAQDEDKPALAICMVNWHLPVHKQSISYKVSSLRKASAIEEYIMKAANLKLPQGVDKAMLSEILGLDEVFTENALSHLCDKDILKKDALPVLELTENGKDMLNRTMVPDKEQDEEISYYINLKTGHVYSKPVESEAFPMHPDCNRIEKMTENIKKYINRKFINDANSILGNNMEDINISEIVSAKTGDAVKTLFTEIMLYNATDEKSYIKVWDHAGGCFRDDIAILLEKIGAKPTYEHENAVLSNKSKDILCIADDSIKNADKNAYQNIINNINSNRKDDF